MHSTKSNEQIQKEATEKALKEIAVKVTKWENCLKGDNNVERKNVENKIAHHIIILYRNHEGREYIGYIPIIRLAKIAIEKECPNVCGVLSEHRDPSELSSKGRNIARIAYKVGKDGINISNSFDKIKTAEEKYTNERIGTGKKSLIDVVIFPTVVLPTFYTLCKLLEYFVEQQVLRPGSSSNMKAHIALLATVSVPLVVGFVTCTLLNKFINKHNEKLFDKTLEDVKNEIKSPETNVTEATTESTSSKKEKK